MGQLYIYSFSERSSLTIVTSKPLRNNLSFIIYSKMFFTSKLILLNTFVLTSILARRTWADKTCFLSLSKHGSRFFIFIHHLLFSVSFILLICGFNIVFPSFFSSLLLHYTFLTFYWEKSYFLHEDWRNNSFYTRILAWRKLCWNFRKFNQEVISLWVCGFCEDFFNNLTQFQIVLLNL